MAAEGKMSMMRMDSPNHRLDSLVDRMNRTSGNQKTQAMAAVINELVAQRKAMQGRMQQMMEGEGMMGMMKDSMATRRSPRSKARQCLRTRRTTRLTTRRNEPAHCLQRAESKLGAAKLTRTPGRRQDGRQQ